MKNFYFLLSIVLTAQIACSKEILPAVAEPSPVETVPDSNIIWAKPITADTSERILAYLTPMKGQLVYVQMKEGDQETIIARDLKTGGINWAWGDEKVASGHMISDLKIEGDRIVVQSWQDVFVLDAKRGTTLWHADVRTEGDCAFPRISVIDAHIYYTTNECSRERKFCTLWRTPISTFQPEKVYTLLAADPVMGDSGWIYSIETSALWQNPTGDSVLIFQTRAHKAGAGGNKADLLAVNLKKRALEWKIDAVSKEGYSSVNRPIVHGNFIYHIGHTSIQKIDAIAGSVRWSHKFSEPSEHFSFTGALIGADGKIYTYPGAKYLYTLDAENGNIVWKSKLGCCGTTGDINLINNKLYLIAPPHLYTVDASSGVVLEKSLSVLQKGTYHTQFAQFASMVRIPHENKLALFDSHYLMLRRP